MSTAPISCLLACAILCSCCQNESEFLSDFYGKSYSDESTIVSTAYGKVQGYKDGPIYTFKGIPYARAERFMPPIEPESFEGVKVCRIYGPKAPQNPSGLSWGGDKESDYAFGNQFTLEPEDESACLVLNVWTRGLGDGKKRPVFVWFHGGGYSTGSAIDLPCYEGYSLAKKGDIVVVTVNHRLNVLGYIDLSGLGGKYSESVNLGQQDLVKALEWINKNIDKFGGDPGQVTIGGQSGGGGKVSTTMAMPSAKGLFHRAIVQSGSMTGLSSNETTKGRAVEFVKALGLNPNDPKDLDRLADFSYNELRAAASKAGMRQSPVVDGKYVLGPTFNPDAPEYCADIPLLVGTNLNEFTFNNGREYTEEEAKQELTRRYSSEEVAQNFIDAFRQSYPNAPAKEYFNTDLNFRRGAVNQAISKSKQGANVYLYLFTWRPTLNVLGASHGMELPFMFNNIQLQREMTSGSPEAYKLADIVSSAWISFIKTGDPNVKGLPKWEPFTEENGINMIIDNKCYTTSYPDKAILEFQAPARRFN